MLSFKDIFKQSFLDAVTNSGIPTTQIAITLALTTAIAMYIFVVYRVFTRKTFYSKSFNIALVAITIITTAIIIAMQSNFVTLLEDPLRQIGVLFHPVAAQ